MNEYIIAKYVRLSVDDAISESMSIPNQHLLLDRHIEALDMPNSTVLEFVDNGYSGTNLERPAVQEMLELARGGGINCIIVKDFSRFSRDAMESGYYIEQIFPLYGVRFIASSDRFDSNDYRNSTGGMDVAFKFLMHEYYSKDLSNKIKSSLHIRMKNGKHIVTGAVYGYRKNKSGKWEPDPEPAEVVRLVFRLALDGLSTSQIRDKLFEARCPSPREYEALKRGKDVVPKYMWATKQLHKILVNEQYTGSYVAGKQETTRVGVKSLIENDRSKWIIIPDSHPALISKEDFAKVQEMLKKPKELSPIKPIPNDTSRACRSRIESGERKSSAVPYGYVVAGGGWEIDSTAAAVVREIYEMTLQGLIVDEICDKLHKSGYPSPAEYFKFQRGNHIQPTNSWPSLRIRDILKNEQYTGTHIAGRTFQDINGKKYHTSKSEWIVVPGKHPAIISKEVFDEVQTIRANSRKNMRCRNYLLRGKVSCGCCGFALVYILFLN